MRCADVVAWGVSGSRGSGSGCRFFGGSRRRRSVKLIKEGTGSGVRN